MNRNLIRSLLVSTLAPAALALASTPALATDVSVGIALGGSLDLPDKMSGSHTRFGPAGSLSIPVRIQLAPQGFLRIDLRADAGTGQDRVSWAQSAGGEEIRLASTDHWAMLTSGALLVGGEARVPGDLPVRPLGGFGLGVAWIGTWHSFGISEGGVDTTVLLDPAQNDLEDPKNIDPFATSLALMVDLRAGAAIPFSDALEGVAEVGYSVAYLPATELQKAPDALSARRDAFGWNALRLQVGVAFTF